jgi:large subunit ribosomal protein L19e
MKLTTQRRIAADVMKCGEGRVWFDNNRAAEIKQAITKSDIRHLIHDLAIQKRPEVGISHGRYRRNLIQKRKGRQRGLGARKGKKTARLSQKISWMARIRVQREFLKMLRDRKKIAPTLYHMLYKKAKGGFFRSVRHLKLYLEEHKVAEHETKSKTRAPEKKA